MSYISIEDNREVLRCEFQTFSQLIYKIPKSCIPVFKCALFKFMPHLNYKFRPVTLSSLLKNACT